MLEALPIVHEPLFWAAALPAAFLIGLSKSGFASGFGALATPLLALSVPVPQAAAILLPVLAVADAFGLQRLWRPCDRRLLALLLPPAMAGIAAGALLFGVFSSRAVAGVTGALTLAFLAQRLLWPPSPGRAGSPGMPAWVGRACALASGFTSFVAHAGSPPVNAYVLPLRLAPAVFAGTMSVFFAVLNASKWLPYALLGTLDARNLLTSALLLPLPPLGVMAGVWLTKRIDPAWFYRLAYTGMGLTGCKLLWDGLR